MRLYHYTSHHHLNLILATGLLKTCESNIGAPQGRDPVVERRWREGPHGEHFGPDVVWLTLAAYPHPPMALGLDNSAVDKTEVRVTVEVDDALEYLPWVKREGINRSWLHALTKRRDPGSWFVVLREVPWTEWTEVIFGDDIIWTPERGDPTQLEGAEEFRRKMGWTPGDPIPDLATVSARLSQAVPPGVPNDSMTETTGDGADARVIRKEEADV